MKRCFIVIVYIFCAIQSIYSQEDGVVSFSLPVRNSLKFNKYIINPTFSFVREQNPVVSVYNKRQWVQFDNAPQTYLFSYSGRFRENEGVAFGLFQQDYGVLTTFGAVANFAHNIKLQEDSNLTFGMNLGIYKSGLNIGKVITNYPDPSLENIPSNSIITINPGINYGTAFLDFGISANNLISYNFKTSKIIEDDPEKSIEVHIMHTGYIETYGFFDRSKFSGLLKTEFKKNKTIVSGLTMLTLQKGIWVQAGYNTFYGMSGGLGLNITPKISLEYNFEKATGNLSNLGSSHEIIFAYKFNSKKYYYGDDNDEGSIIPTAEKSVAATPRKDVSPLLSAVDAQKLKDLKQALIAQKEAERLFKLKEIADAKAKNDAAAKAKLAANTKAKTDAVTAAKQKSDSAPQTKLTSDAKIKADASVTLQAKLIADAKAKTDADAKAKLAANAKLKADAAAALQAKSLADAKAKADADSKAKLAADAKIKADADAALQAKSLADAKAKTDADAKAKLAADAKIKADATAALQAKLIADAKAKADADAKAKLAADAKIKADATAALQAKSLADAKAKADADAKAKLAADAKIKADADAALQAKSLADSKAKADADAKAKLAADAKIKADADAALQAKLAAKPKDENAKSIDNLTKIVTDSKVEQQDLLKKLDASVANKEKDLKELKEENDLGEKGIFTEPKAFKSVSAENTALESLKSQIIAVNQIQKDKIIELDNLYKERIKKGANINDETNQFYLKTIESLKADHIKAIQSNQDLVSTLEKIKVDTEIEKKRRIKRAAFDNNESRFLQDLTTLKHIKETTVVSKTPLKETDFDFGEEQSNVQILKNIKNAEKGYYLVVAVHEDVAKRDAFLTKTVAAGQANINFFYDIKSGKYFIYYDKFDSIEEAQKALGSKGDKPYNGKMSMVKIE